jgi:shikimate kinase
VRGVGETTAAITIVNALPTGIGSAVGVELRARAEIELHPAGSHGKWDVRISDSARSPLVIASLTEALRRFAPGSSGTGELNVHSEIPAARGLKSSSAVSSAIILAVAHATDAEVGPLDIARISASVARATGVSATGALDDALAGVSTGIVITDNRRGELLKSYPTSPRLGVALFVPDLAHRPSPEWVPAFEAERARGRSAADAALAGDWIRAMQENTLLVERVMGYDYAATRAALAERGAIASGVSGMGPALAAIAPHDRLEAVAAAFPRPVERRRIVPFSAEAGRSRGSAP